MALGLATLLLGWKASGRWEKERRGLSRCFALSSARQPTTFWLEKKMCCFELWFFRIKLYSLYSPSGISCQARNHLTDISQRKFQCNFFLIVDFSFPFHFFPFYWRNQMGRKAGASSSPPVPSRNRSRAFLAAASLPHWLEVMMGCLDSGDNCWGGQEFTVKLPLDWGAEVWRVRTAWRLTFGFCWGGLPQITSDRVGMKRTHIAWDAVRCFLVCARVLTWLFCWGLSVWWILTQCEKDPCLGSLHPSAFTEPDVHKRKVQRLILGTCEGVFPCASAWKSRTSAPEGMRR